MELWFVWAQGERVNYSRIGEALQGRRLSHLQQVVDHPTSANVRTGRAAVVQDVFVVAKAFLGKSARYGIAEKSPREYIPIASIFTSCVRHDEWN